MKKEVGRPAVTEKRKIRTFKATDTEWQAIQQMAAERGLSASEYIRNVALEKEEDHMKKNCNETFEIEKAFGLSYVFVSPDWESFLYSFTDDYKEYPPRIAPHPGLKRLGLYYFDKDVAVLVTPAGIYSYGAASLTLRGPAYRPLAEYFEIWGE